MVNCNLMGVKKGGKKTIFSVGAEKIEW